MELFTERCTIRTLQETDFAEAIDLFTSEQVRAYLGGPITERCGYSKLNSWLESQEDLHLCVRLKTTQEFSGIISVSTHHDKDAKELSYQFLPKYWGKGIAQESIMALLGYLKQFYSIAELVSETQSLNVRSCKLLEKLGFVKMRTVIRFEAEQTIYKIELY